RKQQLPQDKVYEDLWQELRQRRIVLLEIDSGTKPAKPGAATRRLAALFDPLATYENAGYASSERDKQFFVTALQKVFRRQARGDLSEQAEQIAEALKRHPTDKQIVQAKQLFDRLQSEGASWFYHLKIECNHHEDDEQVMISWSLPPNDKAVLLSRFLV